MNQSFFPIIIIGIFTFIPLWIGAAAGKESLWNTEDFFVQSRKMSTLTAFFTVYATWWSSFAFLGSSAYFYIRGPVYWTGMAWNILFGVLYYIVGKRIWYYGKINGYITPTDFFSDIYNSKILNGLITLLMMIFTLPYLQIQLSGGAYLIEIASNGLISWKVSGLIFYLIIIIYLWAGGLRAVAWADIFYGILIILGMLIGGIYLVEKVGGMTFLFESLQNTNAEYLKLPGPTGDSDEWLWISMFLVMPLGALMGPQLWIRMYCVKKGQSFSIMPFLLSIATIAYLGSMLSGNVGVLLEPDINAPDAIYPILLLKHAPTWLTAFLLCCGAAAAMSTSNSQIHAISAVYSIDIHKKYINPNVSDRRLVFIGRWAIVFFSAVAYIMLVNFPGLLVQIGMIALSGTAQVFVPTVGALIWKRANANSAIAGLISGITVLIVCTFILDMTAAHGGVIGLGSNAFIFIIIGFMQKNNNEVWNKIIKYKETYNRYTI